MRKLVLLSAALLTVACVNSSQRDVQPQAQGGMVVSNRLSNQSVHTFAEDSFGHVWIGTSRGLNKYSINEYHQYFSKGEGDGLPDNNINKLCNTGDGRLWAATVNGLAYLTDTGEFRNVPIQSNGYNNIGNILETPDGTILAMSRQAVFRYDPENDIFRPVIQGFSASPGLIPPGMVLDANGGLWIYDGYDMKRYDTRTFLLMETLTLPFVICHVCPTPDGCIWISGMGELVTYDTKQSALVDLPASIRNEKRIMEGDVDILFSIDEYSLLLNVIGLGMFYYYKTTDTLMYQDDANFPFIIPDAEITAIYRDIHHNLWFGTDDQGYKVSYFYTDPFNTNQFLTSFFDDKSVVSLCQDHDGHLWIATLRDGLYCYDLKTKDIDRIDTSVLPFRIKDIGYLRCTKVFCDSEGDIWLLAREKYLVTRCSYDGRTLRVKDSFTITLPSSIAEDINGDIWVGGNYLSLVKYDRASRTVSDHTLSSSTDMSYISAIVPLNNGKLIVAPYNLPARELDIATGETTEFTMTPQESERIIRNSVLMTNIMVQDSFQDLLIGTVTNGLLRKDASTGELYPMEGAPCEDICSIQEDRQGNIWVATMDGLGRYDRSVGRFVNYSEADGIGGNQFSVDASCILDDGTLIFGGTHGITWFNPLDVPQKRSVPLVFEDLKVHNAIVTPGPGSPIRTELSRRPDILLRSDQNGFSISFSALDYSDLERTNYFYLMDGFDKYWVEAGHSHEAYYANLPAGKYKFRVRVTNNNQSIVEAENFLNVRILPPWYASWWAILCAILLLMAALMYAIRLYNRIQEERRETEARLSRASFEKEMADKASEQEKELNKIQMNYFSNVAHEFRTPLTMIAGPAAQLAESRNVTGQDRKLVGIIQRNANWMLTLVGQLLDFNRIGSKKLQLQVVRTDIVEQLKAALENFRFNARSKGIELVGYGLDEPCVMWVDTDKITKVVMNLMSNALKFTPSGGLVSLSFNLLSRDEAAQAFPLGDDDTDGQYASVMVTDNGRGIPEDQLEKIFERFYQADTQGNTPGSGIGLYYSKALIGFHHGYIKAMNREEGGALFQFIVPVSASSYSEDERSEAAQAPLVQALPETIIPEEEDEGDGKKHIVVVDDDIDIANYLKVMLSTDYRVTIFYDAVSALNGIKVDMPDLIVSDVVMPDMNGYDFCSAVKGDLQLAHIPVILVTAKVAIENQVKGLRTGADAYVTKPFQPAYLQALVKSLLDNRDKLHRRLAEVTSTDEIEPDVLSPKDNAFLKELYALMEQEMENSELDITRISTAMKVSRTKFYYKVKGLTGYNPSAFFKLYKLNKAAELLKEGHYNVSEIAYMTGFNTLSHFSTSFKKQFGMTPSEYK